MKILQLLAFLSVGMVVSHATPIGPSYPPPGGVTLSGSGSTGGPGGRTNTYSNLDTSAYGSLYWGLWSDTAPQAGLDNTLHTLTFGSATAQDAYFFGTTNWIDADPLGGAAGTGQLMNNVSLRLHIQLVDATFVSATDLGLSSGLGALAEITGTSFSAQISFAANYGNGWIALNSVSQLPANSGTTKSSFSGGFYHTPATSVPEGGATLALILMSMGVVAVSRLRVRRA